MREGTITWVKGDLPEKKVLNSDATLEGFPVEPHERRGADTKESAWSRNDK